MVLLLYDHNIYSEVAITYKFQTTSCVNIYCAENKIQLTDMQCLCNMSGSLDILSFVAETVEALEDQAQGRIYTSKS